MRALHLCYNRIDDGGLVRIRVPSSTTIQRVCLHPCHKVPYVIPKLIIYLIYYQDLTNCVGQDRLRLLLGLSESSTYEICGILRNDFME